MRVHLEKCICWLKLLHGDTILSATVGIHKLKLYSTDLFFWFDVILTSTLLAFVILRIAISPVNTINDNSNGIWDYKQSKWKRVWMTSPWKLGIHKSHTREHTHTPTQTTIVWTRLPHSTLIPHSGRWEIRVRPRSVPVSGNRLRVECYIHAEVLRYPM